MISRNTIASVLDQHTDELVALWNTRRVLSRAGHVALRHLARFDDRIAAHQDGCAIGDRSGLTAVNEHLTAPTSAALFAAAAIALDRNDRDTLDRCLGIAETVPDSVSGITSAIGWTVGPHSAALIADLLGAKSSFRRRIGLAACRLHRIDPGHVLFSRVQDPDSSVRTEALRTAGAVGRVDLADACAVAMRDTDASCRFWAAVSALLLGLRHDNVDALEGMVVDRHRKLGVALALQATSVPAAHGCVERIARGKQGSISMLCGAAIVGDARYIPWIITQMLASTSARASGEAFALITGADLSMLDLDRKPPEDMERVPNDNPDDPNVDMDPDDGLPWPDPGKVQRWWDANKSRFRPGTRYFMGAPVTREHCIEVLKTGYQRQRILAAHYLCLLEPGTPLFNTSAPAWRQQRWLAQMA